MAYENIRIRKPNFTIVDGYFWCVDDDADAVIVKTDDGTTAYSYPLDTTISETITSIDYDGRNLWTMRTTDTDEITIQRWYINNYVCTLRNTFVLPPTASHKYNSEAFTVEHYHLTLTQAASAGTSEIYVNDNSELDTGYSLTLGPSTYPANEGVVEEQGVLSTIGGNRVQLGGNLSYNYQVGDTVTFYKYIWVFNNYDGIDDSTGALYKLDAYTGSYLDKFSGGAFKDVKACTFFNVPYYVFNTGSASETPYYNSICYVKGPNLIFLNPDNPGTASFGSMAMDNVESNQATNIPIYDIVINGTNIYRLQLKATYYGSTQNFTTGPYNYQLSTLESFITSISLSADPAILPATGASSSTITAIVKDQFNLPVEAKLIDFTENDPTTGFVHPATASTDSDGIASVVYTSGTTAAEIRITATAAQG